jgi:putative radical SAM enzyme (TIGR03279 family)
MKHYIVEIERESIAEELGITPGDILLQINGKKIRDVLDYQFAIAAEEIFLEIQKGDEIWEFEIEKDEDEDLGLIFKHALMSPKRRCINKCVFCFVDQQPQGLRQSLYFKDDDVRLSFLHGNYVTLTNLSSAEIKRIASYHLSPLRISVHTTDLALRQKMTNCKNAVNLNEALKIFGDAGIKMHFQAVICKGINDGEHLTSTIKNLASQKGAVSLAIVPAGITRHRKDLFPLSPFTPQDAQKILATIEAAQKKHPFVFAADEWYILADKPLPPLAHYRDFPQLDNGVGMMRLFEEQFSEALPPNPHFFFEKKKQKTLSFGIITGYAAAKFMRGLADSFEKKHPHIKISIHAIKNNFFGENITVSGLLTGTDILSQIKNPTEDIFFLPENAFRANTETMLDGITRKKLSAALGVPIKIGSSNGKAFYSQLISERTIEGEQGGV